MIVITDKVTCCGCWACENICPKHCVVMKEDNEGFRYPEVDVEVCIECGLCEAVCPILHKPIKEHEETIGYVIQHKDNNIRRDSTSGGFFSAISDYVLNQNGYVFGAIYNKKMEVVHYGTNKKEEIQLFRGSKYVQSKIGHTYQEAKKLLQTGCLVCFSGTPCQIAGLKNYLKKDYANLITVDLVCRGNPSPLLFRKYLEYQQIKYKNKVTGVKFRDKYYGYNYSTMTLDFEDERIQYHYGMEADLMLKFFFKGLCSKPACLQCVFKSIERVSDFTIFDCWNAKFYNKIMDKAGATHVFIHSQKGFDYFEYLKSYFVLKGQALYGTSGLLHMPTADMQKDKTVMLGGNVLDKHPLSTYWNNKNYTYTYNYYINVTIFPWLEVAYTCTLVKGVKGNYWPEQTWGKFRNQDRNFSGRLRLWKEGWWKEWTPQLVLGANDPGSFDNNGGGNINFNQEAGTHNYFNRFFLAATKHLYFQNVGELGLHMAYIYSRATGLNYEGPALGVNFRCCLPDTSLGNKILNGLNLMAEYDARTINIGFNYAVWKDRFNLIAELNDGKYLSAGLYFKICLK